MLRTEALEFVQLATTLVHAMTPDQAETIWRDFVITHAAAAVAVLTARDALHDPRGVAALVLLSETCPSCYANKRTEEHKPTCELGF